MAATINSCGAGASQKAKAQVAENETKVLIKTTAGDITVKLYNETPIHRDNFIKLVQDKFYDSILFHRVIRDFMVQAGDPESKNADRNTMLGAGDPGYDLPAEIVFPRYYHKRGALSAARKADQVNPERRSSGSQFYIVTGKKSRKFELKEIEENLARQQGEDIFRRLCMQNRDTILRLQAASDRDGLGKLQKELQAQTEKIIDEQGVYSYSDEQINTYTTLGGTPFLDGQYTVFGEVVDGMNVVEKIEAAGTDMNDRPRKDIRIITMEIIK